MGHSMPDDKRVLGERRGAAYIVTMNRPEALNAFDLEMLASVREKICAAAEDPTVVGIVVAGAGAGFCAGYDASGLAHSAREGSSAVTDADEVSVDSDLYLFRYLHDVPKPVIAAVDGVAAGGGFVLATLCDLRFASSGASFVTVFSRRGLIAEHGTSWLLPRLIGTGAALDLLWSSRRIDAGEAHRLGLVEYLAPEGAVDAACRYVERLAVDVSPAAIADIKRLVYEHWSADRAQAWRDAYRAMQVSLDRPDAMEGALAFLERRAPRFAGVTMDRTTGQSNSTR
jgi:enoyl-CoA hydratase/carnithine racemase